MYFLDIRVFIWLRIFIHIYLDFLNSQGLNYKPALQAKFQLICRILEINFSFKLSKFERLSLLLQCFPFIISLFFYIILRLCMINYDSVFPTVFRKEKKM